MSTTNDVCAVCGLGGPSEGGLSRLFIEGHALVLCRAHASVVARAMPRTFEDTRRLFAGMGGDCPGERRSPIPRREAEDRRVFPPRPEGRRMSQGRRASDPRE